MARLQLPGGVLDPDEEVGRSDRGRRGGDRGGRGGGRVVVVVVVGGSVVGGAVVGGAAVVAAPAPAQEAASAAITKRAEARQKDAVNGSCQEASTDTVNRYRMRGQALRDRRAAAA